MCLIPFYTYDLYYFIVLSHAIVLILQMRKRRPAELGREQVHPAVNDRSVPMLLVSTVPTTKLQQRAWKVLCFLNKLGIPLTVKCNRSQLSLPLTEPRPQENVSMDSKHLGEKRASSSSQSFEMELEVPAMVLLT